MFTDQSLDFSARNLSLRLGHVVNINNSFALIDLGASFSLEDGPLNSNGTDYFAGLTLSGPLRKTLSGHLNINYVVNDDLDVFSNGFNPVEPRDTIGGQLGLTHSFIDIKQISSLTVSVNYSQNPLKGMTRIDDLSEDHFTFSIGSENPLTSKIMMLPQFSAGMSSSSPAYSASFGIRYSL